MSSKNNSCRQDKLKDLICNALKEDIGKGDITSHILISEEKKVKAVILLKEDAIIAGLALAGEVFKTIDKTVKFKAQSIEGALQKAGKIIATLEGNARAILSAERTALNFLSHLSGIATLTRAFLDKVKPYKVKIMDTRKTIPGLRELQKYAVRMGGGYNHRIGLWDGVLIKDNHIAVTGYRLQVTGYRSQVPGLGELIETAKKKRPKDMKIEIEVKSLKEFKEAFEAKPDIIMLDNMSLKDISGAVELRNSRAPSAERRAPLLEVSGGVSLDNVRRIAKTGVDRISIGSLTHSVKAIDLSLEIIG